MAKLKGIKGDFWKTDWFLGVVAGADEAERSAAIKSPVGALYGTFPP